jgi:hypothetical protein
VHRHCGGRDRAKEKGAAALTGSAVAQPPRPRVRRVAMMAVVERDPDGAWGVSFVVMTSDGPRHLYMVRGLVGRCGAGDSADRQACANGAYAGVCASATAACVPDTPCTDYLQCDNACTADYAKCPNARDASTYRAINSCRDACREAHAEGARAYLEYNRCVNCVACREACPGIIVSAMIDAGRRSPQRLLGLRRQPPAARQFAFHRETRRLEPGDLLGQLVRRLEVALISA